MLYRKAVSLSARCLSFPYLMLQSQDIDAH